MDDNYSFDYDNGANGDRNYGTNDTIRMNDINYKTDFIQNNVGYGGSYVCEPSIPYTTDRRNISFSKKSAYILSHEEVEILDRIKMNPHLTQSQIQKEMGISLRSVKRVMSKLQQKGILIRKGNNRSGSWIINDQVSFYR